MWVKLGIWITIIITLISCTEKGSYPVKSEMIDGVKVITNPEYPRDGRFFITLREELSIGEAEQDGHFFSTPGDICISDEGTIFVSDFSLNQISCFDRSGNYIRTFAKKGQGPGDFESLRFTLSQNSKIYAMDSVNARISILDIKGNYIDGFKVLNLSGGWNKIYSDRNNNIYISKEHRTEKGYMMSIHRYDPEGNEDLDYGEFPGDPFLIRKRGDKISLSRSSSTPTTVWIVSEDGKLYAGYSDDYIIGVYDKEGDLLLKFGRKYKPLPDSNNWLEGVSEHLPAFFRRWIIDDAGNLWIQLFPSDQDQEITYDIFSPGGIYLRQVQIKYRIETIKNQRAYCIVPSEEELPLVKRYKMIEISKTD